MRPTALLPGAALLLAGACTDLATEPGRVPVRLLLDRDTATVFAGAPVVFGVTALDENGDEIPVPAWGGPLWSVTDSRIASVDGEVLSTLASGQTNATVEVAGVQETAVLRVNPHEVELGVRGVYLNQSIQRYDASVPLVEGRDALLRVFVTGDQPSFFRTAVRVTLYRAGSVIGTFDLDRRDESIPVTVDEGTIASSWNVLVDGELIQRGTSLVVEVDPEGAVPHAAGSQTRFPATGSLALDVRPVPRLWLRMIPVFQTVFGTTGDVGTNNVHRWMRPMVSKFPIAEVDVDVRAVYSTDARLDTQDGWIQLLQEIAALRDADGSMRYYYGVHENPPNSHWGGLGYVGWPAAIGYDRAEFGWEAFAHELGHNFGLLHAPCGSPASLDPDFPYRDGGIGAFGYDVFAGVSKHPDTAKDLMTYCGPEWISDYSYEKVLAFRDEWDWTSTGPDRAGEKEPALLVWGGVVNGELVLEPAFELEMYERLPTGDGPYRIEGRDEGGAVLFSLPFRGAELDHATGSSGFSFAIPERLAQTERLASLRLSGPEGVVERTRSRRARVGERPALSIERRQDLNVLAWDGGSNPMALVRDAATGEVLSFARGGSARIAPTDRPVEVLLSDGVRTSRADVRIR